MNESSTSSTDHDHASHWASIGDKLESLGLKLKFHAEQAASEDKEVLDNALHSVGTAIEDVFEAVRGVVKDPAIRDDVKAVAGEVAEAVSSTLRGFANDLSKTTK